MPLLIFAALSVTGLIDNAVKVSFARTNLSSRLRRLKARWKRNHSPPRRDACKFTAGWHENRSFSPSVRLHFCLFVPLIPYPLRYPPALILALRYDRGRLELTRNARVQHALASALPSHPIFSFSPTTQTDTLFHWWQFILSLPILKSQRQTECFSDPSLESESSG